MKKVALLLALLVISIGFQSCAMMNDPDFQEGFRRGWNATAPEEYRY